MPCHNCGRTFLPDRLEVHLRSCDKQFSKIPPKHEIPTLKDSFNPSQGSMSTLGQSNSGQTL